MSGGALRNTAELPEPEGYWATVPFPVAVLVSRALTTCPGGCSQCPHVPPPQSVVWGHEQPSWAASPRAALSSGLSWKLPSTAGPGLCEGGAGREAGKILPQASRRKQPCRHLDFGVLTSGVDFCYFKPLPLPPLQFLVISFSSHRKLIQSIKPYKLGVKVKPQT